MEIKRPEDQGRKGNNLLLSIHLMVPVFIVFIFPVYIGISFYSFWLLSGLLLATCISSYFKFRQIFTTVLFFSLVHFSRPLAFWFTEKIGIQFPGTFYLIPILTFCLFLLLFPSLRKNTGWWKRTRPDKISFLLATGLAGISAVSLLIWAKLFPDDVTFFRERFPDFAFGSALIAGLAFAFFNSFCEEFLSRGMLWNGLEKLGWNVPQIIFSQAIIFALFHVSGFPGGLIGMIMVFFWSVILGIIRKRSEGLLLVIASHFVSDFTIFMILFQLSH